MASHKTSDTGLLSAGRHMQNQAVRSHRYRWLALAVASMLVFVVALSGFIFMRLQNNVHTASLNLGEASSQLENGALDILLIGSDTRAGSNSNYGDASDQASGARSDVMMLIQISADRQNITSLSFPRDLMVDIPKCTDPETGTVYPATETTQINESLTRGGPGCTVATISQITGVNIDHFMLVDFNAVKELSKVVGGVEVCVNEPIDDSYSGLKLPAGTSSVEGEQALAFLRSRHGFGDGSDTGRIKAQQGFLAALLRKVQAEGTLTNPGGVVNIAEAITQNVTVDEGLTSIKTLAGLGSIFGQVDLSKVVFATVPTEPYDLDANKLQISADADTVFKRLQDDKSLVEEQPAEPAASSSSAPASSPTEEQIQYDTSAHVTVLNGSGKVNRDQDISKIVKDLGYISVSSTQADSQYSASALYFQTGYDNEAQQIADKLGIKEVAESAAVTGIQVVVGTDFTDGEKVGNNSTEIAGGASGQTADQQTCQQAFAY